MAAPLHLLLRQLEEHAGLSLLCGLAGALALLGLVDRPWRGPLTTIALGALVAVSWPRLGVGWSVLLLLLAVGAASGGLLLRRYGARAGVALGFAAALAFGVDAARIPPSSHHFPIHTWNQFHYVLGTRYFDEVGYEDLYLTVLLADADGPRHFLGIDKIRDMRTYTPLTRREAMDRAAEEGIRARFTPERWARLQADIDVFYPLLSKSTWSGVFRDLGYNPSPAWVALHRPLLDRVDLNRRSLEGLAALQVPMYLGMLGVAWWAFGLRATLWILLWNLIFFGNRGRVLGGYWSYDWLALTLLAAAAIARGRAVAGAISVGLVGMMRGFSGLMALGPTMRAVAEVARGRRPTGFELRFLLVLALVMAGLGGISLSTGRGLEAWGEWADKISLHSSRIGVGGNHLGLRTLFGEDYSMPGITEDLELRRTISVAQAGAYRVAQAILLGWTLLVLPRRGRLDGALLGFVAAFAIMVLSRYYYAAWSVLLLLGTRDGQREGRPVVQLGMFAVLATFEVLSAVGGFSPQAKHQYVNELLLGLAVGTLTAFTVADLRAWRRGKWRPGDG